MPVGDGLPGGGSVISGRRSAAIVGAGIGGLAAARALTGLGYEVRVLERDSKPRTEGAGLTLWPNAIDALRTLGLGDLIEERTRVVSQAVALTPAGALVTHMPVDRIAKRFGPLVSARRADIVEGLLERVDATVEFGVEARVIDGALHADGERLDSELIVGADGIGSAVRELVAPGMPPRTAGYSAWRGVAETDEGVPEGVTEMMGCGKRFGYVRLNDSRTYWFAVIVDGDGSEDLGEIFGGWHGPVLELLAATSPSDRSYLELRDLAPLPRWHRDRYVLIGDAAHAMTPNLGQGAAQALRDVVVLRQELDAKQPAEAFRGYERARKRRAERISKQSRMMGRIVQTRSPLVARLRDGLARRTPAAVAAWQLSGTMK